MTSPLDEGWKINGAGKRYNHKFGFGRLDVSKMVDKALKWKNVDKQRVCHGASHNKARFVKTLLMAFSGDLTIVTVPNLFEPLFIF